MRLISVLVFILALATAAYLVISGYFLGHATLRLLTVGNISSALATATPPSDPLALGYRGTPTEALSLPYETVTIETSLGPAEAWLVPAAGPETGRAIYVHGIAGAREDGYRHLSMLHRAGWTVLLISYRNDPAAPADPSGLYGLGLLEWPDLEAAVLTLAGPEDGQVMVVAESMGGAVLGQFLAQSPQAGRLKAVALDSPAISIDAVILHLATQSGNPLPGPIAWIARIFASYQTGLPLDQADVASIYQAFPGPMFIAHGTGDPLVPYSLSQDLAAARTAPTVTLWSAADHLGSYAEDPAAYEQAFSDFLALVSD